MSDLTVIGVRHHSPACARLVKHVIERERPRIVLVEGPSDMNERMGEFALSHRPPVALFSWRQEAAGVSRGMWSPFCDYSPEWVALAEARRVGAHPLFMDLPAWDKAFEGDDNRYADRTFRASDRLGAMAATLGFENVDALWDHLFEGLLDVADLEQSLTRYFDMLRSNEPPVERDGAREDYMRRFVAWGMAQGGSVVVVCGGYHANALKTGWENLPPDRPQVPLPASARVGSYLVPFSFKRLDAFAGYASGMPSPAWYQRAWETGAEAAADTMLIEAVRHLRDRGQRVSSADAISARALMEGLSLLRGRSFANRVDVLDALAGALVKDALDAPLPWARRGPLPARTEPLLVELVAAFSGARIGSLAPGTPQPPLVADAFSSLEAVGVHAEYQEQRITADVVTEQGRARSRVLHRLRLLGIPGFTLRRAPNFQRHHTSFHEEWGVQRGVETDSGLVEASAHGGTLVSATAARLEERAEASQGLQGLAQCLVDASLSGMTSLQARWLAAVQARVGAEASFEELGAAVFKLLFLRRGEAVFGDHGVAELSQVLAACFERGLWLLEGLDGATAAYDERSVRAVEALRDLAREPEIVVDVERGRAVCGRRARATTAPPGIRGAALGFGWSLGSDDARETQVVALVKAAAHPKTLGDFLSGLFVLAREVAPRAPLLLEAIDSAVAAMTKDDFLVALPSLRLAFSYFPPRERLTLAEAVLARGGQATIDPMSLLQPAVGADVTQAGMRLAAAALERARKFGLTDAFDEVAS